MDGSLVSLLEESEHYNLLIERQEQVVDLKKKNSILADKELNNKRKMMYYFDQELQKFILNQLPLFLMGGVLDDWGHKIKSSNYIINALCDMKEKMLGDKTGYHIYYGISNNEELINLYIRKYKCETELFEENLKVEDLEKIYYRKIHELEKRSVIIGEGSMVTLKFIDDEDVVSFLIEGNYYSIEKGKINFIQTHLTKVNQEIEYELLSLKSVLGNAIKGKKVSDTIEYKNQGQLFIVEIMAIKYAL